MDIKEESCFPDFSPENERDIKDLVKKLKVETITTTSKIKPELEESTCYSQNEEYDQMRLNETIKGSEIGTKIDIKEEDWWLDREDSCINDGITGETNEDFYSAKAASLYNEGVSNYTPSLISSEDIENDLSFNMKNGPDCGIRKQYQRQRCVTTNMSSTETSVCAETSNTGKIVSMAPSFKQGTHECNICKKVFTDLSHFKRHKLIHEGIKPHKCNMCNKAFTETSSLKRHKLIHEGIKSHRCNICNRAFTELSNLKRHKLTHEGIKSHKCNICSKAFTHISSFKRHKLTYGHYECI